MKTSNFLGCRLASYGRIAFFLPVRTSWQRHCTPPVVASVLIVDDDDDIRWMLGALVQMSGHSVREARNGREGLKAVAEERPDLVLLDVEMPVVTGPEMAYALFMRNCGDEKIPIVLLSGIVGLDEIAALVGTPYFLGKPYAPEALMKTMERALKEQIAPRPKLEVRS